MAKIVLDKTSTTADPLAYNENFRKIEQAFNEQVLFRKLVTMDSNSMENPLDMNGNKIYNLPIPTSNSEPARLKDLNDTKTELIDRINKGIIEATDDYVAYYNSAKENE